MGERRAPDGLALIEELINTLDVEAGRDSLARPDELAALSRRAGAPLTAADVPGLRRLREALRAVCLAHAGHRPLPPDRAEVLAGLFADAPLVLHLDGVTGATELRPAPGARPGLPAFTARVAAVVATAEANGTWRRLKACEAETCHWAYYDHSPAGRRRWCSMQTCGARAKMRAYRAKRQAE
ncbi:CGNR zinc finger domain-containing protein [Streptomyces litchfieldiae]|uniref:CGNR zinc finger domain-containing protein n=1 Tax=Streptomyces litchfieldiae TaxID=3075543 RepID=A0ABU2MYS0_9ACTN|nr:CGNR zinc finger domain-containing protein [Streptomyces sp. DSM 44938]MDT0346807.1 CGNR zinc finger domain-containing protein [Streptomyces sp. DSM 44938]